jgi:pheromone shutdown protein TraB
MHIKYKNNSEPRKINITYNTQKMTLKILKFKKLFTVLVIIIFIIIIITINTNTNQYQDISITWDAFNEAAWG